jgi:hypothetical protein
VSFATLRAVGDAVDAEVELMVRWQSEGLDRLLDEEHSTLVATVVELLVRLGWEVAVEASFAIAGERGSIDVLAWHAGSGSVVVVEVKSVVPDNQAMLVALDRKVRLAERLAEERGWTCKRVARLLVIADGRTTRRRIARHSALFDAVFPVRTRAALAWLKHSTDPAPSALLLVPKPPTPRKDGQIPVVRERAGGKEPSMGLAVPLHAWSCSTRSPSRRPMGIWRYQRNQPPTARECDLVAAGSRQVAACPACRPHVAAWSWTDTHLACVAERA